MVKLKVLSSPLQEVEVERGKEFLEVERSISLAVPFGCKRGHCGVCAIYVESGSEFLGRQSAEEKKFLEQLKLDDQYRLACQCLINGNVCVTPVKKKINEV